MCKFFSFTTKGDGIAMYMPVSERIKIFNKESRYENADSHTSINDFFGLQGVHEDKTNKYEACFVTGVVSIDQLNTINDHVAIQKWFNKFSKSKEFEKILAYANIDLRSLQSLPEGVKFPETLNGSLYLRSLQSLPEGVKFPETLNGSLYLSSLQALPENVKFPDTIGGFLYLSSLQESDLSHKSLKKIKSKIWR